MEPIYHLVLPELWQKNPDADYAPESMAADGFIHCCFAPQVSWAANRFYGEAESLWVIQLHPSRLESILKVEPPSPHSTSADLYPHLHGAIPRSVVVAIHVLKRDENHRWLFPN